MFESPMKIQLYMLTVIFCDTFNLYYLYSGYTLVCAVILQTNRNLKISNYYEQYDTHVLNNCLFNLTDISVSLVTIR